MNRRNFIESITTLFSLGTAAIACPRCEQGTPVPHPGRPVNGPYCVEVVSNNRYYGNECTLPIFDNKRQAENFALARMNIMKNANINTGKILITKANGNVCEEINWDQYHTMTQVFVDFKD